MAGTRWSFDDEVVVITGAARGIGRAVAQAFQDAGARVHSLDLPSPDEDVDAPGTSHGCDIADRDAVATVAAAITAAEGRVDVLVNNAATVTRAVPITDLDPAEWDRAIAVNVTGVFNVTRALLPLMGTGGRIINLASTFAHVGSPGRVAYSATKGAILALSRSLALDLAAQGIRVASVSPGAIATERMVALFGSQDNAQAHLGPMHPIGRLGQPEDIAEAVCFLASSSAAFVTGSDLLIDGGYTAR